MEIRASFSHPGESDQCYRIWLDGPVLRIDAMGVWNAKVADSYVTDIRRIVVEQRQLRPHLRAIVDRSANPVFDARVSEILMATYKDILVPGDRIAMVVDSSLTKGHVRKIAGREETEMFLSISAARTWVLAYG